MRVCQRQRWHLRETLNRVIVSSAVYPRFLEIAELARSLCHSWATCFWFFAAILYRASYNIVRREDGCTCTWLSGCSFSARETKMLRFLALVTSASACRRNTPRPSLSAFSKSVNSPPVISARNRRIKFEFIYACILTLRCVSLSNAVLTC